MYHESETAMNLQPEIMRQAMRQWTSGVTIVTAKADNRRHGMTVSSFMPVSLEPALVLVSIANTTLTGELIRQSLHFGVTILSDGQQSLSDIFAGRGGSSEDRFSGIEIETLTSGVPFPKGGLVYLDCKVVQMIPAGTTTLYMGEVTALKQEEGSPLVYFNRGYQELCE